MFQRKFRRIDGQGPGFGDGAGNINSDLAIGAGLVDSCAACHGRLRGSAGFGGDVVTRPDSRDAPHLFGLGLKEMLADEITADLRLIQAQARAGAQVSGRQVTLPLVSKGISYGRIKANANGTFDTSGVDGVDTDLRVRPFFAHGGTISIWEFIVGAVKNEMGLEAVDADLLAAHNGSKITTPSGMVLDGALDAVEAPVTGVSTSDDDGDGIANEVPTSIVDHMEFYLLNYFKAGSYKLTAQTRSGRQEFEHAGCASCHIQDLIIQRDRRVADLETVYDPVRGIFNGIFATATPLFQTIHDSSSLPPLKKPLLRSFQVKNIFTDFKRHDLGPNFYEQNYDGTIEKRS